MVFVQNECLLRDRLNAKEWGYVTISGPAVSALSECERTSKIISGSAWRPASYTSQIAVDVFVCLRDLQVMEIAE